MVTERHIPHTILILMLVSAVAVLSVGINLARETQIIAVEQDKTPLTTFMTRVVEQVSATEALYESHLLSVANQIGSSTTTAEIRSIAQNIVGIEQLTFLKGNERPQVIDLRQSDTDKEPLPVPRMISSENSPQNSGVLLNPDDFQGSDSSISFRWIDQQGHPPHFATTTANRGVLIFRIAVDDAAVAFDQMISQDIATLAEPVVAASIHFELKSPRADSGFASKQPEHTIANAPFLLPIPSRFGDWKLLSWPKTETLVSYRQPVLFASATLSIFLAVAGIFGFAHQRRALHLAEQRVSFVNRVSHELRTPLTNILLNIDLAADSIPDEASTAMRRLDLIREESSRLSRLLENVLTFSAKESSTASSPRLLPCDVNTVVADTLAQFGPSLARKNITPCLISPDHPVSAIADPDSLSQIVSNLISNVEKYAPGTESFDIVVEESEEDQTVTVSVTDHGPGIPKSDSTRIFRPFVRLNEKTTEGVSGTGLGLAIARDLAEKMKGRLILVPDTGETRFELTLPRSEAGNIIPLSAAS